jgi:hypothetical protein
MIHPIVSSSALSNSASVAAKAAIGGPSDTGPNHRAQDIATAQHENAVAVSFTDRNLAMNDELEIHARALSQPDGDADADALRDPMEVVDQTMEQMAEAGQTAVLAQANQLPPVAMPLGQ